MTIPTNDDIAAQLRRELHAVRVPEDTAAAEELAYRAMGNAVLAGARRWGAPLAAAAAVLVISGGAAAIATTSAGAVHHHPAGGGPGPTSVAPTPVPSNPVVENTLPPGPGTMPIFSDNQLGAPTTAPMPSTWPTPASSQAPTPAGTDSPSTPAAPSRANSPTVSPTSLIPTESPTASRSIGG